MCLDIGRRKGEKMKEKLLDLLPAYVRWAMSSPENYLIFWWLFVIMFVSVLVLISWTEEKRRKK